MVKVLSTDQCFMAHVYGRSESLVSQPYIYQVALVRKNKSRAYDKGPNTQEPCAGKLARTVLCATKHITVMLERQGKEVTGNSQ